MSYLRDYQLDAKNAIMSALANWQSTLVVMPTGTGKTEMALDVIDDWPEGDVLCLAHREELVWQPWERWKTKTDEFAEVEMGEYRRSGKHSGRSKVTFASKDSLYREDRLMAAPLRARLAPLSGLSGSRGRRHRGPAWAGP